MRSATGPQIGGDMPKLTDRFLAALKLEAGRKDRMVFDTVCPGLGIRMTAKGTRTFIVQWTDPATRRKLREPIGVWGNISIDQARDAARGRSKGDRSEGRAPQQKSRSGTRADGDGPYIRPADR